MGIPSPLLAPSSTNPLMKSKALSSELPSLGASAEVADTIETCALLQSSTMNLTPSCGALRVLKSNPSWAETQDPSSSSDDRDDHSESSTGQTFDEEPPVSQSIAPASKTHAEAALEAQFKDSLQNKVALAKASRLLQAKGVTQVAAAALAPLPALSPEGAVFQQMLCGLKREGNRMSVVPCMGDDVHSGDKKEVFWCSIQSQLNGAIIITPCMDAAACGVALDANGAPLQSSDVIAGAPVRPTPDSHAPAWVYGAQWPFCVAPTTLILGNLPHDLLQEDLIEILDKDGYSGFYDFLHLPMDPELSSNMGYAIVDLARHEYGLALSALMHGRSSWCGNITSACQVSWSTQSQGLTQLLDHYQGHTACREDVPEDMRPTWFSSGWPHPLPLQK